MAAEDYLPGGAKTLPRMSDHPLSLEAEVKTLRREVERLRQRERRVAEAVRDAAAGTVPKDCTCKLCAHLEPGVALAIRVLDLDVIIKGVECIVSSST